MVLAKFSLIRDPWIPVVGLDGKRKEVSLQDALLFADRYRRIDAGHPLTTAALYRLLLAVLHRALKGPEGAKQAAEWYMDGFPRAKIEAYLAQYRERFELFGETPFWQVSGLDSAELGEKFRSHWTRLSTEEGSGNTTALFNVTARPGGERQDALGAAAAARLLVTHQTFALGGLIQRFTTSAKAAPVATAALFLAEGPTLQATLALNLVPYPEPMQQQDQPFWERPALQVADIERLYAPKEALTQPVWSYASRYSWPSRSVLLLPEESAGSLWVTSIGYGAGVPLEGPGEGGDHNIDPMVSLVQSSKPGGEPYPYKLRRDRLLWRDLTAVLPSAADSVSAEQNGKVRVRRGQPAQVLGYAAEVLRMVLAKTNPQQAGKWSQRPVVPVQVFGLLSNQAKALAMRQESYTLPEAFIQNPAHFHNYVRGALDTAAVVGEVLKASVTVLARQLLQKDGDRAPDPGDIHKLAGQIPEVATYWQTLESPFRQYLLELDGDADSATFAWHRAVQREALGAWRLAEEAAGLGSIGLRAVSMAKRPLLSALGTLTTEHAQEEEGSDDPEQ